MNTKQRPVSYQLQANRHLKEQIDTCQAERNSHYSLRGKHKQETTLLLLNEVSIRERVALLARQIEALRALTAQIVATRLAMQARHQQEQVALNQEIQWNSYLQSDLYK